MSTRLTALPAALVSVVAFAAGCGDDGGGDDPPGDTTVTDSADTTVTDSVPPGDGDVTEDATADADAADDGDGDGDAVSIAPPPPYTVGLQQDRMLARVGQAVVLDATVAYGEAEGEVSWRWEIEGGTSTSSAGAAEQVVSFAASGDHSVRVVATDGAGDEAEAMTFVRVFVAEARPVLGDVDDDAALTRADVELMKAVLLGRDELSEVTLDRADVDLDWAITLEDLAMLEDAVVRGEGAPRRLSPMSGSRGKVVRIVHPALLDPGARASVRFGDAAPLLPVRAMPGYATTLVPLTFTAAREIEVVLEVDAVEVERWSFSVKAPATPSPEPGRLVIDSMTLVAEVAPRLNERVEAMLATVEDADDSDKAPLRAIAATASDMLVTESRRFVLAFEQLDPEARTLLEELALANGLAEAYADLAAAAETVEGALTVGESATVIDWICTARRYVAAMQVVAKINAIAANIVDTLTFLQLDKVPQIAPWIKTLSAATKLVKLATDLVDYLSGLIPIFGSTIDVAATWPDNGRPGVLQPGEDVTLATTLPLRIGVGVCVGVGHAATKFLLDRIRDYILKAVTRDIPSLSGLYDKPEKQLESLERVFVDRTRAFVDTIVDLVGIDKYIGSFVAKLCTKLFKGKLESELTLVAGEVLRPSCGAINRRADGTGSWRCDSECAGQDVEIAAFGPRCASTSRGGVYLACRECDAENCPDGCCTPTEECRPGTTSSACGFGGEACAQCEGFDECQDRVCQCVSDCTPAQAAQGKRCEGSRIHECVEVAPGCFKEEKPFDCAVGEASCEDGACVGGCGDWNCPAPGEPPPEEGYACCGRGGDGGGGALECRTCKIVPWGGGTGEPHMVSFDGLTFDFQAVGEFVLVEPERGGGGGGPRVQVRIEPLLNRECPEVATIRAVAAAVGASRVTFAADSGGVGSVMVDAVPVALGFGQARALDGGVLVGEHRGWSITWDDGTWMWVEPHDTWLNVRMTLAERWRGAVRGMLGDFDGTRGDDLTTRDGDATLRLPAPWSQLYGVFGESYRVGEEETLFDYPAGTGWGSFDDPSFPATSANVDALAPARRAAAEAVCQQLADLDPALFEACVLDVACTDPSAARAFSGLGNGELERPELGFAVTFGGWTVESELAAGNWEVSEDGTSVRQTINGDPTFFVSPDAYIDTIISGTMRVDSGGDDDIIGFAFGYNAPLRAEGDGDLDFDMLLLSWKQKDQTSPDGSSPAGFTLARVVGTMASADEIAAFWTHDSADSPTYTTLAQVVAPDLGWELHRDHELRLEYAPDRLRIAIDGGVIFDLSAAEAGLDSFPSGRFAFYNYSQQGVTYANFFASSNAQ